MEKDHGRREDILRQEISDLQQVWPTCDNSDIEMLCELEDVLVHSLCLTV